MPRGPRKLRIVADGVGLTQFGGVALIREFFQQIGMRGALSRQVRFPQRNNRYSISESLEALLYPLVLGLGRIETTNRCVTTVCFIPWRACRAIPRPPACDASYCGWLALDEMPWSDCTTRGERR